MLDHNSNVLNINIELVLLKSFLNIIFTIVHNTICYFEIKNITLKGKILTVFMG